MVEAEETFDPEERSLCSDGACTGLVGADGRCKVCGRPGTAPSRAGGEPAPYFRGEEAPASEAGEPSAQAEHASAETDEGFDDDRQLCPDGNCTGLVGSDGKCKVCGLSATANASS